MQDPQAAAAEMYRLHERWEELNAELVPEMREFAAWMRVHFPLLPGRWPGNHLPYQIYPFPFYPSTPGCEDYSLDFEQPTEDETFRLVSSPDSDGDRDVYRLPFLWLTDRSAFLDHLTDKVSTEEQNKADAQDERKRKELALALADVQRLQKELGGNV